MTHWLIIQFQIIYLLIIMILAVPENFLQIFLFNPPTNNWRRTPEQSRSRPNTKSIFWWKKLNFEMINCVRLGVFDVVRPISICPVPNRHSKGVEKKLKFKFSKFWPKNSKWHSNFKLWGTDFPFIQLLMLRFSVFRESIFSKIEISHFGNHVNFCIWIAIWMKYYYIIF